MEQVKEHKALQCRQENESRRESEKQNKRRMTPYERTRAYVYATGNKWAIENFHATHD